ncbi:hypothetical protein IW261DRAFT_1517342 [Armillaria novae-zelandiae]|uniref:DUF6699 domain-containing protein n=1 Tax=Armillaria novae-zelandiae TaxID=153914 RepID=A0AA39U1L2_9AGAR|nr:hypothetical protein IW261DRAFT_1521571 [Armillaria novae-zelandiae]KAK0468884.1 hypothetical protein IW261DRAFT_1517342 [Armillaria novae-zelandiae]
MFPPHADTNGIWDSCSQPPSPPGSRNTFTSSPGVVALSPRPLGPPGPGPSQWAHTSESPSGRQDQAPSPQSPSIDPVSFPSTYPSSPSRPLPQTPQAAAHMRLPSQIAETAMIHPMLQLNGGQIELDFSVSLACARIWGRVTEPATLPPLPSLAVVNQMLPWPIVVQRSAIREWVTVADVVETIWRALQVPIPWSPPPASPSLLMATEGEEEHRERTAVPRLACLKGRTRFVGLTKDDDESDTWILHVA